MEGKLAEPSFLKSRAKLLLFIEINKLPFTFFKVVLEISQFPVLPDFYHRLVIRLPKRGNPITRLW